MKKFNKELLTLKSSQSNSVRDLKVGDNVRLTTRSSGEIITQISLVSPRVIRYRRPGSSLSIDSISIDVDSYYRDKSHVIKIEKI